MVTEEKPIVRMTADSMEAYVMLITPDDGGEYKGSNNKLNNCRKHWMTEVSSTE